MRIEEVVFKAYAQVSAQQQRVRGGGQLGRSDGAHVEDRLRRQVFDHLRAAGIGVNVHYIPVHLQPYYEQYGFRPGDFPVAEQFYAEAITLPLFQALPAADQDKVVRALAEAFQTAKA